jgi:hypothetical protein
MGLQVDTAKMLGLEHHRALVLYLSAQLYGREKEEEIHICSSRLVLISMGLPTYGPEVNAYMSHS